MATVCVFAGSAAGSKPAYRDAAIALGAAIAANGDRLVYGGAEVGLMGAVANAALDGGAEVIGVIPESIARLEVAHTMLTELVVVASMHERKATMADLADAFVSLPGGFGTLDETFEALTWTQLGIQKKPVGLVNIDGYYDQLLTFLDNVTEQGFVRPVHRDMVLTEEDPAVLLDRLRLASVPSDSKLVDR
ncbi:MAG: TIGR00730 family Rossman fold protein [Pseudomonadota bacterium]